VLKKIIIPVLSASLVVIFGLVGCSKTDSAPASTNMAEYYPLVVGKYITYQLDSTVFINLSTKKVVRSYIVQDFIDAQITDNLGNPAYRIRRMMRSITDTTQWFDNASFVVVPSLKSTLFIENNLKFIKLINPVADLNTWAGNSFINTDDNFLRFYENWEYFYENVEQPIVLNNKTYPETITVNQIDLVNGDPSNKNFFYAITKSSEVYAKGIGLVYKDFLYEAWQPSTQNYEANCYGIKLTILNHNF
jgi:hypothetical protein